jgi:hypothetical protein
MACSSLLAMPTSSPKYSSSPWTRGRELVQVGELVYVYDVMHDDLVSVADGPDLDPPHAGDTVDTEPAKKLLDAPPAS